MGLNEIWARLTGKAGGAATLPSGQASPAVRDSEVGRRTTPGNQL